MSARLILLALLALPLGACQSSPSSSDTDASEDASTEAAPDTDTGPTMGDDRLVRVSQLTPMERKQFTDTWKLFLEDRPTWPYYRDAWLNREGAAPYVLAENLYGYFFRAAMASNEREIDRVAENAAVVGEPAVAYFAKTLVLDRWPLDKPVTVEIPDPDDLDRRIKRTFHHFVMDDMTRQFAARVLARIGTPSVATLSQDKILRDARPTSRRYAAYALGRIGGEQAIGTLRQMAVKAPDWQDRSAAVLGMGEALERHPTLREDLNRILASDPDPFVRKKAAEALAGRTRVRL